jgi:hypothetical protein
MALSPRRAPVNDQGRLDSTMLLLVSATVSRKTATRIHPTNPIVPILLLISPSYSLTYLVRHFPFVFTKSLLHNLTLLIEALLYNPGPIIQNFHLNFKIIPAGSAYRAEKAASSHRFAKPLPFPAARGTESKNT